METIDVPNEAKKITPNYAGFSMSKTDFLDWSPDDGFVYEWSHGVLEPTHGMKQDELYIIQRITRRFTQTSSYQQFAELVSEINCWVTDQQMRRPDLALYTAEQIRETALGQDVIPAFVIEIISEYDEVRKVEKKLIEYFQAGVQVVWRIIPEIKTVSVYTSPKTVTICTDTDLISAAPVVPDMTLTVNELFKI
ncbi:Uma2 family endonuclease [Larkinella terrae]|uniref:Uma2 family endonuclease n=1 Tax=Larkinella terrae TaxID=2025311 RepID=A0A7K0EQ40_9BACT|nr:Uma2 family endonuclease [Larkinella terrae]MRS63862.1 Uma2 family endonuclease [Larkinella terrae]